MPIASQARSQPAESYRQLAATRSEPTQQVAWEPADVSQPADVDRLLPPGNGGQVDVESGGEQTFETFRQEAEKVFLAQKLREHDWNVSETARALKMPRSNLYKKIERYGLTRESA